MSLTPQRITDHTDAEEALADLCRGLCLYDRSCLRCSTVSAQEIPEPFAGLLVHHDHMTTTLQRHYGRRVDLQVLRHELGDDLYRRKILLTLAGSDTVVEFGVVRIDLSLTPGPVREAILERKTPLGDVLARHDVLRRIEPRWYLRVEPDCPLVADHLGGAERRAMYGRIGTIYCDNWPAIELLEITTGAPVPCSDSQDSNGRGA